MGLITPCPGLDLGLGLVCDTISSVLKLIMTSNTCMHVFFSIIEHLQECPYIVYKTKACSGKPKKLVQHLMYYCFSFMKIVIAFSAQKKLLHLVHNI